MSFVPSMREIARRGGRLTTQQLSSVGVATGCSIINRSDVNTNNTIVRSFSRKKSSNSNRNGDTTTTAARSNRALVEKDVDVDSPAEQFRLLLLEFPSLNQQVKAKHEQTRSRKISFHIDSDMKHNRISALAKKQVKDKMIVESIDRITINHGLYRFLDKNDFEIISHRLEEKGEKEREVITIVVENNKI